MRQGTPVWGAMVYTPSDGGALKPLGAPNSLQVATHPRFFFPTSRSMPTASAEGPCRSEGRLETRVAARPLRCRPRSDRAPRRFLIFFSAIGTPRTGAKTSPRLPFASGHQCTPPRGIERTWPGGSPTHMAWRVANSYGLAGRQFIWPGGSPIHMAWRVANAYGLAGRQFIWPGGSRPTRLVCERATAVGSDAGAGRWARAPTLASSPCEATAYLMSTPGIYISIEGYRHCLLHQRDAGNGMRDADPKYRCADDLKIKQRRCRRHVQMC